MTFVDGDDWVEPHMCKILARATVGSPDIIAPAPPAHSPQANMFQYDLEECGSITGEEYFRTAVEARALPIAAWRYAFRLVFLRESKLRFKEGILFEDFQFTPRALAAADSIATHRQPYYHHQRRSESITTSPQFAEQCFRDACESYKELQRVLAYMGENVSVELGNMVVDIYLSAYRRAPRGSELFRNADRDFVRQHLTPNATPKTLRKAQLFLLSPTLFRAVGNACVNFDVWTTSRKQRRIDHSGL